MDTKVTKPKTIRDNHNQSIKRMQNPNALAFALICEQRRQQDGTHGNRIVPTDKPNKRASSALGQIPTNRPVPTPRPPTSFPPSPSTTAGSQFHSLGQPLAVAPLTHAMSQPPPFNNTTSDVEKYRFMYSTPSMASTHSIQYPMNSSYQQPYGHQFYPTTFPNQQQQHVPQPITSFNYPSSSPFVISAPVISHGYSCAPYTSVQPQVLHMPPLLQHQIAGVTVSNVQPSAPAVAPVYYCEPCDKEFTQITAYQAHTNTHEPCSHPGCTFTASKKVVIAHFHGAHGQYSGSGYKMVDVEGQQFRVLLGSKPEEIEAWKQERRARFPTKENVEKRAADRSEVIAAGGVVPSDKRSKKNTNNGNNNGNKRLKSGRDEIGEEGSARIDDASNTSRPSAKVPIKKPCTFFAKGNCREGDNCRYSHSDLCPYFARSGQCSRGSNCKLRHDSNAASEPKSGDVDPTLGVIKEHVDEEGDGGQTHDKSVMTNEETSNENIHSDDRADDATRNQSVKRKVDVIGNSIDSQTNKRSSNIRKRVAAPSSSANSSAFGPLTDKRQGRIKDGLFLPQPYAGGLQGTLLRKLLSDEMSREENLILQCIRCLVNGDFLQESAAVVATVSQDQAQVSDGVGESGVNDAKDGVNDTEDDGGVVVDM